jgi:hypothetical protein
MTWKQLKNYIEKQDSGFLNGEVLVYDFYTGGEYEIDVTELLYSEDKQNDSGWIPYLAINTENSFPEPVVIDVTEGDKNGKTKETGFN